MSILHLPIMPQVFFYSTEMHSHVQVTNNSTDHCKKYAYTTKSFQEAHSLQLFDSKGWLPKPCFIPNFLFSCNIARLWPHKNYILTKMFSWHTVNVKKCQLVNELEGEISWKFPDLQYNLSATTVETYPRQMLNKVITINHPAKCKYYENCLWYN